MKFSIQSMSSKNLFFAVMATALISNAAFASQARQAVMGNADPFGILSSGTHGSLAVDDNYNIFYNPAYANDYKNWMTIEKNNRYAAGAAVGSAEGGFVANMMNMNVGLFMNRFDAIPGTVTAGGTAYGNPYTSGAYPLTDETVRPIDLIVAGDMGAKWGVSATYGGARSATNKTLNAFGFKAGLIVADFEPFLHFNTSTDKTSGVTDKRYSYTGGVKYKWGEWTPFISGMMSKYTPAAGAARKFDVYGLGVTRNSKLGDGTFFNYTVSFWRGGNTNVVPLDMSIESDLATWFTARGGLNFRVYSRTEGNSDSRAPTARLGGTFKFGKFSSDLAIGGNSGAVGDADSASFDVSNGLFTTASVSYRW